MYSEKLQNVSWHLLINEILSDAFE